MLPSLFSAVGRLCASGSVVTRLFRLGCRVDNEPNQLRSLGSRGCRVVSLPLAPSCASSGSVAVLCR